MTMPNFTIDSGAMREIVAKAILDGISTEQRDLLMAEALAYLTTPPKNIYGSSGGPSPLQQAFNQAIQGAAVDVVRDVMQQPENQERVRTEVHGAMDRALAASGELPNAISYAVAQAVEELLKKGRGY